MRKNKIEGPIKGSGRKPNKEKSIVISLRISKEAKEILDLIYKMDRGKYVSEAIIKASIL